MQDEPQIILRPLDEADIPRLLDIAVAAWDPIYASFRTLLGPDLFATAFPDWQTDKRRQIASACRSEHGAVVIVAERDGEPVGFISYYLNQTTKIGEIGNNAVDPQYQGAGIGPRMYDQALAQMREAGMRGARVTTGGDPSHAPARRAYEKAGFTRGLPSITYYQAL